jgi:hypothetical protein
MEIDEEKEERNKGFKVDDRRRFSAEGELKPEHRGPEAAAAPQSSTDSGSSAAERIAQEAQQESRAAQESKAARAFSERRAPIAEITFGTFVVGLSTQALMHLGEIPDPHTNQSSTDLPAAQQLIDIIAMLQEKTHGNLDRDEEAMLEAILFELRMKYVERARR